MNDHSSILQNECWHEGWIEYSSSITTIPSELRDCSSVVKCDAWWEVFGDGILKLIEIPKYIDSASAYFRITGGDSVWSDTMQSWFTFSCVGYSGVLRKYNSKYVNTGGQDCPYDKKHFVRVICRSTGKYSGSIRDNEKISFNQIFFCVFCSLKSDTNWLITVGTYQQQSLLLPI